MMVSGFFFVGETIVIPAKAGIQPATLDSRLRGNDGSV